MNKWQQLKELDTYLKVHGYRRRFVAYCC